MCARQTVSAEKDGGGEGVVHDGRSTCAATRVNSRLNHRIFLPLPRAFKFVFGQFRACHVRDKKNAQGSLLLGQCRERDTPRVLREIIESSVENNPKVPQKKRARRSCLTKPNNSATLSFAGKNISMRLDQPAPVWLAKKKKKACVL